MVDSNQIKRRLNEEIKHCGLSNAEIAKRVGISATMLTQYKTTNKMPTLENFANICKVIDSDANYILGLVDY